MASWKSEKTTAIQKSSQPSRDGGKLSASGSWMPRSAEPATGRWSGSAPGPRVKGLETSIGGDILPNGGCAGRPAAPANPQITESAGAAGRYITPFSL